MFFPAWIAVGCGARTPLGEGGGAGEPADGGGPGVTCPPVPATPTKLADVPGNGDAYDLAIGGAYLYYGVTGIDGPSGVYRVPLAGGASEPLVNAGYAGGAIAVDAAFLYFPVGQQHVVAVPLGGGQAIPIANPSQQTHVGLLHTTSAGLFWGTSQDDPTALMTIAHWDPTTRTTTAVVTTEDILEFFVDETNVYWRGASGVADQAFYSAPIQAGAPKTLKTFPGGATDSAVIELLGIDTAHLVYTGSANGGPIARIDKAGGNDATIVADTSVGGFAAFVDDRYVFWNDGQEQATLLRAPTAGGAAPETIDSQDNRFVDAIVTDACHIVWSVVNPDAIMVRAR
jgi:hypothetical protein